MGVCSYLTFARTIISSPTELLLNKVVYVVVNQILLKLFVKQTPLFGVVPCGSVVKTKTTERCFVSGRYNHPRMSFQRTVFRLKIVW